MYSLQVTLDKYTELKKIKSCFTDCLGEIKEELDQHLDSINQNSLEIQSNYDFLEELNSRVEKLESRLDELTSLFLNSSEKKTPTIKPHLNSQEKEIFLTLYTSQEPLSYEEIAHRTSFSDYLIEDLINTIKIKGVPIIKKSFAGKVLVILDEDFKDIQAKENIININHSILNSYI